MQKLCNINGLALCNFLFLFQMTYEIYEHQSFTREQTVGRTNIDLKYIIFKISYLP